MILFATSSAVLWCGCVIRYTRIKERGLFFCLTLFLEINARYYIVVESQVAQHYYSYDYLTCNMCAVYQPRHPIFPSTNQESSYHDEFCHVFVRNEQFLENAITI
ncbi:unnamed protein product [Ixodes pacificus]